MRVLSLTIVALLGLQLACAAEETGEVAVAENAPPVVKIFREGFALLKEAEATTAVEAKAEKYHKALERFDAVLKEKPDLYPASANAAYCVNQLAELTIEPAKRQELVLEAFRRYEATAKLPTTEPRMFGSWAALLITQSRDTPNPARRREILEQAIQVVKTGLAQIDSKAEKAPLFYQFGRAELFQAQVTSNRSGRRKLYESALAHFKLAADVDTIAKQPQFYASWGIVLLELARFQNDHMLMRQAIERLQTALEKDAKNQTVRYNLVCAYALLGQAEPAMRHLQTCLDNDDAKHTYFNAARQDPDFDSLRATPEFNRIFGDASPNRPVSSFEKPVFSDK